MQTAMHRSRRLAARVAAFTLVELLVVIGIIALLISILLPSLNAARQAANVVKCQANLHSMGEAIMIYTGTSKGVLPYGYWSGTTPGAPATPADSDRATDWAVLLMSAMGKGFGDYNHQNGADKTKLQDVFACPSAKFDALSAGTRKLHYACHPRLMPILNVGDYYRGGTDAAGPWLKPYKMQSIQRSAEIALIFDAAQVQTFDWNANATANNLDGSCLYRNDNQYGHQFNYLVTGPTKSGATVDMTQAIFASNGDSPTNGTAYDIRWRHNRNDTANALFVDGHATSFRLRQGLNSDMKTSNIYVNP